MAARVSVLLALGAALLLHTPHRVLAAAYAPPIEIEVVGPPVIAVGEAVGVTVRPATPQLFCYAEILFTWTGSSETSLFDTYYYLFFSASASFTGITPGIFDVSATADWSAAPENMGLPTSSCITTASAPASVTVVDVTNVVASAYHLAAGTGPVFLVAQMTPVNAPDKVSWELIEGGGEFSTTQGLTTQFYPYGWSSSNVVAARCGTNRTEVVIRTYNVIEITATPQPAVAGEPITLTAITEPIGCPLPITWNISPNTGATITNAFGPGTHTVTASLGAGTFTPTLDVVSVGVKEILYEWPANSDNWHSWTNQLLAPGVPGMPVGETFRVKAIPEPESAAFPAGWPQWSGAASGTGAIATASYGIVSTNSTDYQLLTATSGTSSRTEQAIVFRIDRILVATNHVAIGTNTLALTAEISPAGLPGAEYLVGWECTNATLALGAGAGMDFPCNQSGIFTITATCGSSSVATNIYVYRVTGLTASANPVAVGETNVGFTAIVEPAGCPLPLVWSGNGVVNTNVSALSVSANCYVIGMEVFEVGLGTSTACVDMWTVGVKKLVYRNWETTAWEDASGLAHELLGSTFSFIALPDPVDAPSWPAGWPSWHGTGVTVLASSIGPLGFGSYNSVSSTLGDTKSLTVKCGTSSKSATTIVFDMTLSNVPTDVWPDRSYSLFGLGEVVTVTNTVMPPGLTASAAGVVMRPLDQSHYNVLGGSGQYAQQGAMSAKYEFVTVPESTTCWLEKRGTGFASNSLSFIPPTAVLYTKVTQEPPITADDRGEWLQIMGGHFDDLLQPALPIYLRAAARITVEPTNVSFSALTYIRPATILQPLGGADAGSTLRPWAGAVSKPLPGVGARAGLLTDLSYLPTLVPNSQWPAWGRSGAVVSPVFRILNSIGAIQSMEAGAFNYTGLFQTNGTVTVNAVETWTGTYSLTPP
ncbi:MAG: hypothetical protein B9S33_15960 [Pedosphaera sp. Tous-C6FEB]|nr:MAG: hypothetical protein B9S33_15960 [Pedosphaera sp. Tous-C6FEB]